MLCQFLLYNKVNQLYVHIYPHIPSLLRLPPTLPIPPLQVATKHRADPAVLCSCFPLAIYFTFGSVYISMLLSNFFPAYPSPSPCPQVHSLCLRLYSCPAPSSFRFDGQIKTFTDKQKLREFSTPKSALQQMLKELLQAGNTREGKDLQKQTRND